jgi:hypothetical protein
MTQSRVKSNAKRLSLANWTSSPLTLSSEAEERKKNLLVKLTGRLRCASTFAKAMVDGATPGYFQASLWDAKRARECSRARLSAAPMIREMKLPSWRGAYSQTARATRLEDFAMPSGSLTCHRRSLRSTFKTIVAMPGGCSLVVSRKTKSPPMWVMLRVSPLTIIRISTWAEWAP